MLTILRDQDSLKIQSLSKTASESAIKVFPKLLALMLSILLLGFWTVISGMWIISVVTKPNAKMWIDWLVTIPMHLGSLLLFLVSGLFFLSKAINSRFVKILFKWSNYVLMISCIWMILSLSQLEGIFVEWEASLFGVAIASIPAVIIGISYNLRKAQV